MPPPPPSTDRRPGTPPADHPGRVRAALLGVHVGDSLGATTEFCDRDRARQLLPAEVDCAQIVGGGTFAWPAGAATDDTDLTLAIVRAYLATGFGSSAEVAADAAERMLDWFAAGPRDVGGATAEGLTTYRASRDPATSGATGERSQGNGSLMRTVPVALAHPTDRETRAAQASLLSGITHGHRVCRDACVAYCDLLAGLVGDTDLPDDDTLADHLDTIGGDERLDPAVRRAVRAGVGTPLAEVAGVNGDAAGWVLTALSLSVAAVTDPRPAAQVLIDVVRLGGDADTNGAICGGLLGARDGAGAWPRRWVESLEHRRELHEAAAVFATRL